MLPEVLIECILKYLRVTEINNFLRVNRYLRRLLGNLVVDFNEPLAKDLAELKHVKSLTLRNAYDGHRFYDVVLDLILRNRMLRWNLTGAMLGDLPPGLENLRILELDHRSPSTSKLYDSGQTLKFEVLIIHDFVAKSISKIVNPATNIYADRLILHTSDNVGVYKCLVSSNVTIYTRYKPHVCVNLDIIKLRIVGKIHYLSVIAPNNLEELTVGRDFNLGMIDLNRHPKLRSINIK